ncbi:MAG: hypothetical protein CMM50_06730 [Rhodospirillaceae bacterium]|nr:hypothetical protein [Rhodospirillaceae bacterium]
MSSQTAVFTERVCDHLRLPPLVVEAGACCEAVVRAMGERKATAALVTGPDGLPIGIVTERDVVARIACRGAEALPIDVVMTAPVATIRDDDLLFRAIAFMRRRRLRHMPVINAAGRVVGLFELHDALTLAEPALVDHVDRLARDDSREGLRQVKEAQSFVASRLMDDGVATSAVMRLISDINIDLHRRAVDLARRELEAEGSGTPPVDFAMIVMGSGGRGESGLTADQDNGFILADYPDEAHGDIDPYFRELAERTTVILDVAGLPFCRGGVMATNPLWRKTATQWRNQIALWLRRRNDAIVRLGDIFFDFRHACGAGPLSQELRDFVTARLKGAFPFLQAMQSIQADHRVALGWMDRLRTESAPGGRVLDLKYGALLPLVEAVRLLSLRDGVRETGTISRLHALQSGGTISRDESQALEEGLELVAGRVLRAQIAGASGEGVPGYGVPLQSLTLYERRRLRDAMRAIRDLRGRLRAELTGDLL